MQHREVHLFRAGELRLGFVPATDALLLLDEVGWAALSRLSAGADPGEVRRQLAAAHGPAAADRVLDEWASVHPGAGNGSGDPGPGDLDRDWYPSAPERPQLKSLCLNVAHDCDLACAYCFAGRGGFGGQRGLMSREVARAAVDLLLDHSGDVEILEIDFFGGEPLLNLDVVRDTVDYARRRGRAAGRSFSFTLTTNAYALDPEAAAYLNETMSNVVLSLDGRPEVHDRLRKRATRDDSLPAPGTHARVLANTEHFVSRRGNRDYWVRGTYTAHNLDFASDVAYLADRGFRNISLEPVVGVPAGAGGLTTDHLPAVAAEYLRLAELLAVWSDSGRPVNFFHFINETDAEGPCYAKRVRGCGAGREYMAVTPGGDLYPCHQFVGRAEYRVGSVWDGAISPRGAAAEVGRLWLGSKSECSRCWARFRCSGGCHANGLAATGTLTRPDPLGCALLRARLEASLYLQARLRQSVPAQGQWVTPSRSS